MNPAAHDTVQYATQATHDAISTAWRLESAKVIGAVARLTHDVGVAEELAADAVVAALEHWRPGGVPAKPGAWLTTTAKRRALDWLRHRSMAAAEHEALARDDDARPMIFAPSVIDTLVAAEADPVGDDWMRPALCDEALRLARMLIRRELAALAQAESLCSATRRPQRLQPPPTLGPYALQAAIAACHARALRAEETDWLRICNGYDALMLQQPSPVVALNRAVAVSQAHGPAAALPPVQVLMLQPQLAQCHLLPSVLANLLARLGRHAEARPQWLRAAELTRNARERELLLARAHNTPPEGGKS